MIVFCEWVGTGVDGDKLSPTCMEYLRIEADGVYHCDHCERSPAIALGTPVEKLLENLK